jgi:phosphatidylserine decarboxylase
MKFRPIDRKKNSFTSPVDGVIIAKGKICKGQLLQVKGRNYSLQSLLDSPSMSDAFQGGNYLTIYMSPGKYHRVHASTNGLLVDSRSIKGRRFPVNRFSRIRIGDLYPRNERLISYFHTSHGLHSLVMVGSCQVGSVQLTNPKVSDGKQDWYQVEKGQEIAWFDFGSTVILLWPKDRVNLAENKKIGDEVLVGEIIATAMA